VTLKTGIIPWLKVWLGPIIPVQLVLTVLGVPYKDSTTTVQLRNKNDGRVGGLLLMQDTQLIETLAHFSRERIPERVVHASAAGGTSEGESQKLIVVLTVDISIWLPRSHKRQLRHHVCCVSQWNWKENRHPAQDIHSRP
jgi:Catalase